MIKIHTNARHRDIITAYIEKNSLDVVYEFNITEHSNDVKISCSGQNISFNAPFRFGSLIDQLQQFTKESQSHIRNIIFHNGYIDIRMCRFTKADDHTQLTEKEMAILIYLNEARDAVSKEDLLKQVWGYVEGIETHTIETHIYRLRQKIEIDPSSPKNLITLEGGYSLQR